MNRVMNREIRIEISTERRSAQDFIKAWHRAKRGTPPEQPVDRLYFPDLAILIQVLTPRRLEALRLLHEHGPWSIRRLARETKRDYKNVHQDIQILKRIGLVTRAAESKLAVPWSRIVAEIALAA
jgi:predicted transcriptional regulator